MPRLRMRTNAAGPEGTYLSGREYDVSDVQHRAFVGGGYAESLERSTPVESAPATEPGDPNELDLLGQLDLNKLSKADLVELAEQRGVSAEGTKAELVERILDADMDGDAP